MPPLPSLPGAADGHSAIAALPEAVALLARHRLFGLTWLDRDLVALFSYGGLAEFVPIGSRVTETVLPLLGLDDALLALKQTPQTPFEMPNVSFADEQGSNPRLSILVYWIPERQQFLLLVAKVLSTGELEIGLAQQVRARMIAEAELARKSKALAIANEELSRANRDLAEFAYIISHDLKAPLRAMRYFVDDLERALADGGDDPKVHAGQIRSQARRMAQMLTDLLAYSKIGRQTEALATVDTAALVQGIVASIPKPPGFDVVIDGDWPTFETYAAPLDLVLRNLIGNAIAHHDRTHGTIRVTCGSAPDAIEVEVADDGPGIPKEWQETIFLPFKTMPGKPDAEHSGIGLALVRRAAESVGARLTLTSDPTVARGAKITVHWPVGPNS